MTQKKKKEKPKKERTICNKPESNQPMVTNLISVAVSLITELADRKDIFEHFAKSGISAFLAGRTLISDKQDKIKRIKCYTLLAGCEFLIGIKELCNLLVKEMDKHTEKKPVTELRKVNVKIKKT